MLRIMLALAVLAAGPAIALAQTGGPDTEDGRYSLRRVEDGLMRLDRETGAVSFCRKRQKAWICEAVPDDRRALEAEIDRLGEDNAALAVRIGRLQERVAELEAGGQAPQAPDDPDAQAEPPKLRLPSDQEIDQAMKSFESMMRRFLDMVRDLKKDYEEDRI